MSGRGGSGIWGWLLAAAIAAGLIVGFTHRDTVNSFLIATGKIVGSVEGAGGSP